MKRIVSVICLSILVFAEIGAQHKVIKRAIGRAKPVIHPKSGIINQQGDTIVPFIYCNISPFVDGIACVSVRNYKDPYNYDTSMLWGLIDKTGKETVPFIYQSIIKIKNHDRYIATDFNTKNGVIDSKGDIIIPFEYEYIYNFPGAPAYNIFFCKKENEGCIILNSDGERVNPNEYDSFKPFHNYQRVNYIVEQKGKKGLVDRDGKELIPCRYDKIKDHWWWSYKSPIPVAIGDKWGCVDSTGVMVIPCEYIKERGYSFSEKTFTMETSEKRVVFDLKGNILLSTPKVLYGEYGDKAFFTRESYLTKNHLKSRLAGLVTKDGENITPFMYERMYRLSDKYFLASLDDKTYGVIDHKGKTVQPFEYTFRSRQYDRNLVWLVKNGKAGLIDTDKKCKVVLDFEYDNTDHFNYLLSKNDRWGAFDKRLNKVAIPVVYDSISRINWDHRKMYCVMKDRKWGIVDSLNNEVVPIEYDQITSASNISWWTQTRIRNKYGLVDNHYKTVLPCKYDGIRPISLANWLRDGEKKYVAVSQKGKEGVIEISGSKASLILPFQYKSITYLGDNFFQVINKEGTGVVNADNKQVIPCSPSTDFVYSEGVFIIKKYL